eukprot:28895_5
MRNKNFDLPLKALFTVSRSTASRFKKSPCKGSILKYRVISSFQPLTMFSSASLARLSFCRSMASCIEDSHVCALESSSLTFAYFTISSLSDSYSGVMTSQSHFFILSLYCFSWSVVMLKTTRPYISRLAQHHVQQSQCQVSVELIKAKLKLYKMPPLQAQDLPYFPAYRTFFSAHVLHFTHNISVQHPHLLHQLIVESISSVLRLQPSTIHPPKLIHLPTCSLHLLFLGLFSLHNSHNYKKHNYKKQLTRHAE